MNTVNDAVLRKEQTMQIVKQNSAQLMGDIRTFTIGGLQKINTYSSLLSVATAVDGEVVYSTFFTSVAIISEAGFYVVGYESAPVVYRHSYIDAIYTPLMNKYPVVGATDDFVTRTLSD